MVTIFGYPLRAAVLVDGKWVDVSDAFEFDAVSPSGVVEFNHDKVLDAADRHLRATAPAPNWSSPGLLPHCTACGCMTQPPTPCTRPDCDHRVLR